VSGWRSCRLALIIVVTLASTTACSSPPEIAISDVSIPAPLPSSASIYLSIENRGGTSDRLIGVDSSDVEASLHRTTIAADGLTSMVPVKEIEIPDGETVRLEPGSLHLMVTTDSTFESGQEIPLTLTFETSGAISTVAVVE
jgi:copper(I)-binding protein